MKKRFEICVNPTSCQGQKWAATFSDECYQVGNTYIQLQHFTNKIPAFPYISWLSLWLTGYFVFTHKHLKISKTCLGHTGYW